MKTDWLVKFLLLLAVIFLGMIATRPSLAPPVVRAQSEDIYPLTFELKQRFTYKGIVYDNVAVDLRNGNVWAFVPFGASFEPAETPLPVYHPVLLGRLALEEMKKK